MQCNAMQQGYVGIIGKLTEGLDIKFNHRVKAIHYNNNKENLKAHSRQEV